MCNPCGYPSLDQRARADISTASLNMADDARRGTSIHGQEAQLHLSRMYTFRQAMSHRDAVHFAIAHPRKEGNFLSKLVHSKFWDTTIGRLESWLLLSKSLILLGPDASISQLPDMSRRRFITMYFLSQLACRPKKLSGTIATKHSISKSRSWRISTIDQLEPLIDDLLLLSDYPTQEGRDLPAMRAWI